MPVIRLTSEHTNAIRPLFKLPKFMGVSTSENYFVGPNLDVQDFYHDAFVQTYLTDLNNYHAYGYVDDEDNITSVIGFYESIDDASWYWNQVRTLGNNSAHIKAVLDRVMQHNEEAGRFKFYSMFPKKYAKVYRRTAFSESAKERYGYFDEYQVEAKHQSKFNLHWQILYNRTLVPVDTVVRCTFLKQEYRTDFYNAGRL